MSAWKHCFATIAIALTVISIAVARSSRAAESSNAAKAAAVESEQPILEVEVSGERPGPQLWRASKGDHVLWLLGTLDPLPKRMAWRSRTVQDVLIHSQAVIASQPAVSAPARPFTWIGVFFEWRRVRRIPAPETLKDWVEPGLYERFEALKTRYDARDSSIEHLRPIFAALEIDLRVLDAVGLVSGNKVEDTVLRLARKYHVRVLRTKVTIGDPRGLVRQLDEIPRAAQLECLRAVVNRLDSELETMTVAARAWADGDVGTLRGLSSPDEAAACAAAFASSDQVKKDVERGNSGWYELVDAAVRSNQSTLAIRSIYDLLGPRGVLANLTALGYRVEGP